MSLIKCNECGKEISDTAKVCPGCGYKMKKGDKKTLKWILIITIPTLLILAGIIITICIINNSSDTDDEPDTPRETETMSYKQKQIFADEAINFAKAAETAYVDKFLDGDGEYMFTAKELLDEYITKGDHDFKGCIVVEIDRNGYVGDKTVYLTNGKYMIVDETVEDIVDDIDYAVEEYDSYLWEKDYESCKNID